jgi:purine-binding chemotaxis protein CheW
MLGLPQTGILPFAVVIRHGGQQVGVLVDRVPEIRTIQKEELLPAPSGGANRLKPFVSAVLRVEERIGGVVEVPTLLAYVETS